MVQGLSRKAVCFSLVSAATVTWTSLAAAEPLRTAPEATPEAEPPPTLAEGLVDDLELRVQQLVPSLAGTLENLHVKGRGLEYRRPLDWEGRELELRVRGGGFKGKGIDPARGYGLRVELRF